MAWVEVQVDSRLRLTLQFKLAGVIRIVRLINGVDTASKPFLCPLIGDPDGITEHY